MVKTNQLLSAVKAVLRKAYPDLPEKAFYTNLASSDFVRPSFLIESGPREKASLNYSTLEVRAKIAVTAFGKVDKIRHSHVEELEDLTDAVEALFLGGIVELGTKGDPEYRALEVTATDADTGFDYGQVTVMLEYEDERPMAGEDYPLMGEVEVETGAE